jgi:hypothetical protein
VRSYKDDRGLLRTAVEYVDAAVERIVCMGVFGRDTRVKTFWEAEFGAKQFPEPMPLALVAVERQEVNSFMFSLFFFLTSALECVQAVAKKPWFPNQVEPSKNFVKKKEKDVGDEKTTKVKKVSVTGAVEIVKECKKRKEVKSDETQTKKVKNVRVKQENDPKGEQKKDTINKKKKKNEPKQPKDSRFPMQLSSDEANWRKRMSFCAT